MVEKFMEISIVEISKGRATCEALPTLMHVNYAGKIDTGWMQSVLISAMDASARSAFPQGAALLMVELTINFTLRPEISTGVVRASAMNTNFNSGKATIEANLSDGNQEILAYAVAVYKDSLC